MGEGLNVKDVAVFIKGGKK